MYTNNQASNATQIQVGYKLEGTKRKGTRCKATGKIHDINIYGLLREDWKRTKPKVIKSLNEKIKNELKTIKN